MRILTTFNKMVMLIAYGQRSRQGVRKTTL